MPNSDCTFIHLKGTRRKENGASREVTDTRAVPPKNNSKPHSATNSTDHFLELKRLVDTMLSERSPIFAPVSYMSDAQLQIPGYTVSRSDRGGVVGGSEVESYSIPTSTSLSVSVKLLMMASARGYYADSVLSRRVWQ